MYLAKDCPFGECENDKHLYVKMAQLVVLVSTILGKVGRTYLVKLLV